LFVLSEEAEGRREHGAKRRSLSILVVDENVVVRKVLLRVLRDCKEPVGVTFTAPTSPKNTTQ
jgi:CheY-like chemotaxis protein